ncbi:restriction endonuclease subunit S [Candidatus Sumerlaeota bacterium]|nr:restriction endonuclease subunit S [Candidatus Sumerlaeota bacterium]
MLDRISFDEGKVHSGKRTATKMVQYRARPGDIVVSKINARKRAIGIVQSGHDVGITIHFRALIPDSKVIDTTFLWLALRSSYCRNQFEIETGGIGKGEISEERLRQIEIPLPPLSAQRAIVGRWRAAQEAVAAAGERIARIERETQARFLGDLGLTLPERATPPKAFALKWQDLERWGPWQVWEDYLIKKASVSKFTTRVLGKVIADLQNGWSPKCLPRPASDSEWGVLKVSAVTFGYDQSANKALPPKLKPRPQYEVKEGDVLITRANTKEYVGACAFVPATRERLMLCDKIFRVVFRESLDIDARYLSYLVGTPPLRRQIEKAATGSSPSMKNITKTALLALMIPLPPLSVQRAIMKRVGAGRAEIAREREAADRLRRETQADVEEMILGVRPVR